MQQTVRFKKLEIIHVLRANEYSLPLNPRKSMATKDLEYIIGNPNSCLKTYKWTICPLKIKANRAYLVNRIRELHIVKLNTDCWISHEKRIGMKYLIDYLYSLDITDTIFFGRADTKIPRNLKKPRKIQIPPELPLVLIAPKDLKDDAEKLFSTMGKYFTISEGFTDADWRTAQLGSVRVRYAILKKLKIIHSLIRKIN